MPNLRQSSDADAADWLSVPTSGSLDTRLAADVSAWTVPYHRPVQAMTRAAVRRSSGAVLAAATFAALAGSLCAGEAGAATFATQCTGLQSTINSVAAQPGGGEGDVIVLDGLCSGATVGAGGVTLPAGSSFTLQGQPGTVSGLDGAGITAPLLATAGAAQAGSLTLSGLTFEHAQLSNASALLLRATRLTLSGVRVLENHVAGEGAHAADLEVGGGGCSAGPPSILVSGSSFSGNTLTTPTGSGSGAGAWISDPCGNSSNVIEGSTFQGNSLHVSHTEEPLQGTGAGLSFAGAPGHTAPVTQAANTFDSNTITALAPAGGDYGGAGEWLEYASLTSIGDRFSGNLLAGTSSPSGSHWSWGAGLGIDTPSCAPGELTASTLEDDVLSGNAIGPGNSGDLGGGGIWVGCSHLRVLDSTVTLNSAPNGSGIEGEAGDSVELVNSILAMDSGGYELTGFNESPAAQSVSFSDACVLTGSAVAHPGTANICANPLLADNGNPASSDVHETPASPTIAAGSAALIPAGLTRDFYGEPRFYVPATLGSPCSRLPVPTLGYVDMGASEVAGETAAAGCRPAASTPGAQVTLKLASLRALARGILVIHLTNLPAGRLTARATYRVRLTTTVPAGVHTRTVSRVVSLVYAESGHTGTRAGNVTVSLRPTRRAARYLLTHRRVAVTVALTLSAPPAGVIRLTRSVTVHGRTG